ncbi:MAG TPA: NAD(P)/FAD-dependent oxidoreductase [Candidatus Acidoferrum sp.]|nr:NAD(P)/FAD-dependent oxidoreductase [Candidatus Acidoferrum sp.]
MSTSSSFLAHTNYDVAVIGGGPGGAALATFLARNGHRCVIFEQAKFPRYHIGESLIPHTHGIFERLGLLPQLRASAFPVKYSVRFVSDSGKESVPFYFSETIPGERARTWQVERSQFDTMMLNHARANGVEVHEQVSTDKVIFDCGRAVGVQVVFNNGSRADVQSKVVVDASGRACVVGRQLNLRNPLPELRKASALGYFSGGQRLPGIDAGETTMFLIPGGGWFWYIPLPDDIVSVGIVADPEYVFSESDDMEAAFTREIALCAPLAERLAMAKRVGPVRGSSHLAYLNRQTCGDGWVMIGDARAFLDPIYSSGLYLALGSAELAAQCIDDALKNDDVSAARLGRFEPALWKGVDVVRRLIHAFYDPNFSFPKFAERFPEHRAALIDCLVGDVIKDMSAFTAALAQMTPPPPPLGSNIAKPLATELASV